MKKVISFIMAAAICAGCQKEISPAATETKIPSDFKGEIEEYAYTKTYLDENNNIRWSAKDQVIIFAGTTAGGKYQITDKSAGETSADYDYISTAGGGFGSGSDITSNVAFYPFQSNIKCANADSESPTQSFSLTRIVLPAEQTYQAGSFGQGTFPMVAVTRSIDDMLLRFKNVGGGIKLLLKGDIKVRTITVKGNNDEPLAGTASVTAYVNGSVPKVTMADDAGTEVSLDCGKDGVQLNTAEATAFIISIPPTDFKNGFSISIIDTKGYKMDVRTSKQNVVERSKLLRMPEIKYKANGTAPVTDAENIVVGETANSYIISKAGSYSIPAVKGNSMESVGEAVSAEVLWESFGTETAPEKGDLVIAAEYSEGKILFRVNDEFKEGNAVIAAKDGEGKILWSWHIWLVEDEIAEHEYGLGAGVVMDRNLGATSAVPGESGTAGLMYQYGRKDPFLSGNMNNSKTALSSVTWPEATKEDFGPVSLEYAAANPMVYITASPASGYQWYNGTNEEHKNLWQSEKTIYDPCPAGWRIPDGGSEGIWKGGRFDTEFNEVKKGISVEICGGVQAWYPSCGFITSGGGLAHFGERGCYWAINPKDYPGMNFNNNGITLKNGAFCDGYSVRCFKEDSEKEPSDLSVNGTANSYIVSETGFYSFPAVKGNSSESVGKVASAEVLWESFGTNTAPEKGDLIPFAGYSDGAITFNAADAFKEGNAVIAAKDGEGNILWSWHIWLVEDEIEEHVYANNAGTMMDRNLGAVSATRGDIGALGLLYQWGRKDPFLNASSLAGTVSAKSTIEWPTGLYTSDATIGTIEYTIQNPTVFIGGRDDNSGENETSHDWYYDFDDEISQTRWADEKTIYDPCPAGWQVSSFDIWILSGMAKRYNEYVNQTPDEENIGFSISHNGYDIWFPTRGAREMNYTNGNCELQDQWRAQGSYWSNCYYERGNNAYIILFTGEGGITAMPYYPDRGYQVRCQKIGTGE